MAIWFLITWTTLIMPLMALTIEIPHLLTARLHISHAARSALYAGFQQCSDFQRYQDSDSEIPFQQSQPCVERAAAEIYTRMLAQQSITYPQAATLTLDRISVPGEPARYSLRGCLPYTPRMMPHWTAPAEICVAEVGRFEFRASP